MRLLIAVVGPPPEVEIALPMWLAVLLATGVILAAVVVALLAHVILFRILTPIARRTSSQIDDLLVQRLRPPSRLILPLLALLLVMRPVEELAPTLVTPLRHLNALAAIAAIVWSLLAIVGAMGQWVKVGNRVDVPDNFEARRLHTQITVLERTLGVFIIIIGVGVALMTFDRVRELGVSMLASAGIAGLVVGFASRPVLENLIGGVQIALTQPIRLDDVVIIDGEWGRIEEITTTYVVVRIWDQRRLVVPFSKFINESFQNWTRRTADILGTIFIYADYRFPVQALREELERLVKGHEKWDGRVCVLQVTDATERTMELRALVSAAGSGEAWDLRVYLREKLIEFIQREYPECLPRTRVELPERRLGATRAEPSPPPGPTEIADDPTRV